MPTLASTQPGTRPLAPRRTNAIRVEQGQPQVQLAHHTGLEAVDDLLQIVHAQLEGSQILGGLRRTRCQALRRHNVDGVATGRPAMSC